MESGEPVNKKLATADDLVHYLICDVRLEYINSLALGEKEDMKLKRSSSSLTTLASH